MKEKLTRNIGLKILSIILAAILWFIITNVDDPVIERSFPNVKVEILNADEITALNQVYSILEGSAIDFTASARRSVADKLAENDFKVTADLSKLSELNTVTIHIQYRGSSADGVKIKDDNQVMKVDKEELSSKHFQVKVIQIGKVAKGYYIYETSTSEIVKVSGPKSKIETIEDVVVEVDVTGYTKSFISYEQPKAMDKDGKEVDANLTFSKTSIPANVNMYNTKTISLNVTPTGKAADGYVLSGIEYEPKTIIIAAADDVLSNMSELSVQDSIEGASANINKEIKLKEQLPSGVMLADNNETVVVNISIEKSETKEITIMPSEIDIRNKSASIKLDYLTTGPIVLKITGPSKEIDKISKDELNPYIDLSNYVSGTYSVKIGNDFTGYTILSNTPMVNIRLISSIQ